MTRLLAVAFFVAHGLVHAAVWARTPPAQTPPPFPADHSWAMSLAHASPARAHALSVALAWTAALGFLLTALAIAVGAPVWVPLAASSASMGLALKLLYFNSWLVAGVLLDAAILYAALAGWPPSLG